MPKSVSGNSIGIIRPSKANDKYSYSNFSGVDINWDSVPAALAGLRDSISNMSSVGGNYGHVDFSKVIIGKW